MAAYTTLGTDSSQYKEDLARATATAKALHKTRFDLEIGQRLACTLYEDHFRQKISQSKLCRFENLELTPRYCIKLEPVFAEFVAVLPELLQKWKSQVEQNSTRWAVGSTGRPTGNGKRGLKKRPINNITEGNKIKWDTLFTKTTDGKLEMLSDNAEENAVDENTQPPEKLPRLDEQPDAGRRFSSILSDMLEPFKGAPSQKPDVKLEYFGEEPNFSELVGNSSSGTRDCPGGGQSERDETVERLSKRNGELLLEIESLNRRLAKERAEQEAKFEEMVKEKDNEIQTFKQKLITLKACIVSWCDKF